MKPQVLQMDMYQLLSDPHVPSFPCVGSSPWGRLSGRGWESPQPSGPPQGDLRPTNPLASSPSYCRRLSITAVVAELLEVR